MTGEKVRKCAIVLQNEDGSLHMVDVNVKDGRLMWNRRNYVDRGGYDLLQSLNQPVDPNVVAAHMREYGREFKDSGSAYMTRGLTAVWRRLCELLGVDDEGKESKHEQAPIPKCDSGITLKKRALALERAVYSWDDESENKNEQEAQIPGTHPETERLETEQERGGSKSKTDQLDELERRLLAIELVIPWYGLNRNRAIATCVREGD